MKKEVVKVAAWRKGVWSVESGVWSYGKQRVESVRQSHSSASGSSFPLYNQLICSAVLGKPGTSSAGGRSMWVAGH